MCGNHTTKSLPQWLITVLMIKINYDKLMFSVQEPESKEIRWQHQERQKLINQGWRVKIRIVASMEKFCIILI